MDLFVYGTLRPGQYNDIRTGLGAEASLVIRNVTTKGAMFNVRGSSPIFPVVNFDGEGVIIGDLLCGIPEDSIRLQQTHDMEVSAGYELRNIYVRDTPAPSGRWIKAVAYHYPHTKKRSGIAIPDGDWLAFCG